MADSPFETERQLRKKKEEQAARTAANAAPKTPKQEGLLNPEQAAAQARRATRPLEQNPGLGGIQQIDPDQVVRTFEQANQPRGPETQTTRFGAFDDQGRAFGPKTNQRNQAGAGSQGAALGDASGTGAASRGGTFSVVQGSDPFRQLAAIRSLREPQTTSGGGIAIAPNSATRERNARLNDPNRRLAKQLDRDVRLGRISARAARGIQQDAIQAAGSQALGREKLVADQASNRALQQFRERQLASQEQRAAAQLGAEAEQSVLDRQQREAAATLSARIDAAKLGETQAKRAQEESQFQRTQQFNTQKLDQQSALKVADLMQQAATSGDRTQTARLGQVSGLLEQLNQGGDPQSIVPLVRQLIGDEQAAQIFPQYVIQQ